LLAGAIDLAGPERMCTFTQVGDDWQRVRGRMKKLTHDVRSLGLRVQWCWSVEPNPKGTGHHVHAWQWGDFVPQKVLAERADGVGMGRVTDIRRWRVRRGGGGGYGLKLAGVRYGLKEAAAESQRDEFLAANGGRPVHASRGFWRADGERLSGVREACEIAGRLGREDEREGTWLLMREDRV
jgi:hypothetical protein